MRLDFKFFILFLLFFHFVIYSQEVDIKVVPKQPVVGEKFHLVVTVSTKLRNSRNRPFVSFYPFGTDVLGKKKTKEVIDTVIINGKVNKIKRFTYIYDLVSSKVGNAWLRNIRVDIDGKRLRSPNLNIRIKKSKKKKGNSEDAFILAISSKKSPFLGEGIDVGYYLYLRAQVSKYEVKRYPKLEGFLKRFYFPNEKIERVNFNGMPYKRSLKYSARLYPEKVGILEIDSLKLKVRHIHRRGGNFSKIVLGSPFRTSYKVKILENRPIKVNVRPIPTEGRPKDFTGLVGEHIFKISINKTKFLVNEAIELKFEIEGEGALEKYDAPIIYNHSELEEFDKKSKIERITNARSKKIFDYTFLARAPLKINQREINLYYFEPQMELFKGQVLTIPGLIVGGQAISSKTSAHPQVAENNLALNGDDAKGRSVKLFAPLFEANILHGGWLIKLNGLLLISLVFLGCKMIFAFVKKRNQGGDLEKLYLSIKKQGLNYSKLYKVIIKLKDGPHETLPASPTSPASLISIVDKSSLSEDAKKYFKRLIEDSEKMTFNKNENLKKNFSYVDSFFKELVKNVSKKSKPTL